MISGAVAVWRPPFSQPLDRAMESVLADVDECFRYDTEHSYKDRAHAYLVHRGVGREAGDTAVQRVVRDVAERAYQAGVADAGGGPEAGELAKRALVELADLASTVGELRRALGPA